ncbi:MAG: DUF1642 domain-containing protein [Streptococcus gallolyticus]|uniref:DUF1642 domain-containing protein n=1 Tax=Streptococcus gallolyticus TaxID=315405 RepID=A0A927XEX7_9STRE|nr:DUF1642 domain-containing protein [Streptococcus gallolyticus]
MKYKKGDDVYLKGQIVGVSSCSEVSYPYEVLMADEFIDVREKDIVSVNEPEKAILNEEEAEWLERLKKCPGQSKICDTLYYVARAGFGFGFSFRSEGEEIELDTLKLTLNEFKNLKERLVKALIYGYEVKKEKLYTVFQPATNEFLYTEPSGSLRSDAVTWTYAAETEEYHFTQQKLEELHYWANPAFEIKEVKQ